jgi:hypothetical protein
MGNWASSYFLPSDSLIVLANRILIRCKIASFDLRIRFSFWFLSAQTSGTRLSLGFRFSTRDYCRTGFRQLAFRVSKILLHLQHERWFFCLQELLIYFLFSATELEVKFVNALCA